MKTALYVTKVIWQITLYAIELISISLLLTYLTTLIQKCDSAWCFIERALLCYSFYQIIVVIILNNLNDIEKDACLAYMTNLKKLLLYANTRNDYIKKNIEKNIKYQLERKTINNNKYKKAYIMLEKSLNNIDKMDRSYIEMELIHAEHIYEFCSLNWRYSFLLRLFKNRSTNKMPQS